MRSLKRWLILPLALAFVAAYWMWADADCHAKDGYLSWAIYRYPVCVSVDGRFIP